jgi:acyl dehydratase
MMDDTSWTYRVTAVNHATTSANRIHDDEVAVQYGFRGGLVPGVDVYAYLVSAPARQWGIDWLRSGGLAARFTSPVYDGDEVTVTGERLGDDRVGLTLRNASGETCAEATARRTPGTPSPDPAAWPAAPTNPPRLPASPESLAAGTAMAPIEVGFHADRAGAYLAEIGEDLPLFADAGIAHPGWLLRSANSVFARHVQLGPWIHVASDAAFFGVVHDGARVEIRAVVADEYERNANRFVVLDVLITADGHAVQRVTHTAIHTPRTRRRSSDQGAWR